MIQIRKPKNEDIPVCGAPGHVCGALKSIEELSHETDYLKEQLVRIRREHSEDCHRLWFKIGGMMVALAAVLPTGWASFLGLL